MKICARVDNPAAVLRQRLEALASQLAELESLRDRVGREENRQRELRQSGHLGRRASSECNRAVVATSQTQSSYLPLDRDKSKFFQRASESERMTRL